MENIKRKLVVAFDIDDCLIIPSVVTGFDVDTPNYKTIDIYKWFESQDAYLIVWSGGGIDYAKMWATKLGLQPDEVRVKQKYPDIDIAFDDCIVNLAKVNIQVKRFKNNISRKE